MKYKNKLIILFSLVISFLYAFLYVLANNNNTNNLKNYEVGIVNLDKNKISKDYINTFWKKSKFKIKYYENLDKMKSNLNEYDSLNLGIVIDKNFSFSVKNIANLDKVTSSSVIFYQNSKINQMNLLINQQIINEANSSLNTILNLNNGQKIQNMLQNKLSNFEKLKSEIKKQKMEISNLYNSVIYDVDKYENLLNTYKIKFKNFEKDIKVEDILNYLNKTQTDFKNIKSKFLNLNSIDIIKLFLNKQTFENLENQTTDPILKNEIKNISQKLPSVLDSIKNNLKNENKIQLNAKLKEILLSIHSLNLKFNKNIANLHLNENDLKVYNQIKNFNDNLYNELINLFDFDFTNLSNIIKNFKNISKEELVSKLFNLNLNEVKQLVNSVKNQVSKSQIIKNQINELKSGLSKLLDGISVFDQKLNQVSKKTNFKLLVNNVSSLYKIILDPLDVNVKNSAPEQTTGQLLIPFALMLGLWVLTLFTSSVVINYDKDVWKQNQFKLILILSFMGSIHYLFVKYMGLNIQNYFIYILNINLIGFMFYQIQRVFYEIFSEKSAVFLTIFFIIMIVGSGLTIPIELADNTYNVIYWYDPLHYCANIIRELISTTNLSTLWIHDLVIIGIYFICSILVTVIRFLKKRRVKNV